MVFPFQRFILRYQLEDVAKREIHRVLLCQNDSTYSSSLRDASVLLNQRTSAHRGRTERLGPRSRWRRLGLVPSPARRF